MPVRPPAVVSRLLAAAVAVLLLGPALVAAPASAAPGAAVAADGMHGPRMVSVRKVPKSVAKVRAALRIAKAQQGDPYQYGGAGPDRFDCSGLVYYATHRAGLRGVPRTSAAQSRYMKRVGRGAMRAGDFVFFTGGSGVYHVGIYVGRDRVLHAPRSGQRVRIEPLWTDSWFGGTLRR